MKVDRCTDNDRFWTLKMKKSDHNERRESFEPNLSFIINDWSCAFFHNLHLSKKKSISERYKAYTP